MEVLFFAAIIVYFAATMMQAEANQLSVFTGD